MTLSDFLKEHRLRDLASALGVPPPLVSQWKTGVRRVPAERVLAIEAATGHRVSRHDLRPDIYPREPWCRCPACERKRREAEKGEEAA